MLKVLGKSSEPRFINLITEILNKTHDKKIQKYAKSALKEQKKLARKHLRTQNKAEIQQYVKGSYELKPIYDSYVAPTQYEAKKGLSFEQLMQYKLIHSELRPLKKVIMTMFKNNESNPNILDVLAERIYQMNEELETFEVDTIAWGAKVLGQSNNNRYKSILTSILTSNFDNRSYKKHIGKAVKTLSREEKVEQYQPNEISLEKLRDEISVAI